MRIRGIATITVPSRWHDEEITGVRRWLAPGTPDCHHHTSALPQLDVVEVFARLDWLS
jgi:hypothetical protein